MYGLTVQFVPLRHTELDGVRGSDQVLLMGVGEHDLQERRLASLLAS